MNDLIREFTAKVLANIDTCRELGYSPYGFEGMLEHRFGDAVALAKDLVVKDVQDGLRKLAKMGRLDLSIEQVMIEPRFAPLFQKRYTDAAKFHLNQVGDHHVI